MNGSFPAGHRVDCGRGEMTSARREVPDDWAAIPRPAPRVESSLVKLAGLEVPAQLGLASQSLFRH